MARLNISIPDALYERLDRLRDRVNASKVCAAALEKELTMIESPTVAEDSTEAKATRLIERLRTRRDEWYQQGLKAGESWLLEVATLQELSELDHEWTEIEHVDLMASEQAEGWQDHLPESFTERDTAIWEEPLDEDPTLRGAYLLGWHKSVSEIWNAARGRLTERSD